VVTKNGWLNVFNLQRGDRRDRVHVGDLLQSVAISGDGKYLAVGVGSEEDYNAHDVSIRPTDNIRREILKLNLRGDIQDIVANPNPEIPELYIVNTNADKVRIFNFAIMELTSMITLGGSPSTFTVSPDGKKAYATLNARNIISVIDIQTRSNLVRYDVIGAPHYVAFSPDGKQAIVTDREKNIIYFIDNENDELIGYKEFHPDLANVVRPEIVAFSNNAGYIYLISGGLRELMVIDVRTMQMVQNHSLPKRPNVMYVLWNKEKA
jgi:WD40 repeat protein